MTKSGQIRLNASFSSSGRLSHLDFSIQDASGDRLDPLGRVNSDDESNTSPVPFCSDQFTKRAVIFAFFLPVCGLIGVMMINCPSAVISIRKSLLSRQRRKN